MPVKINAGSPRAVERVHEKYNCEIIECSVGSLTPELIQTCRDLGIQIMVREGAPTKKPSAKPSNKAPT